MNKNAKQALVASRALVLKAFHFNLLRTWCNWMSATDSIDNRRRVLDMANTRYVWHSLSVPISIKQNYDKYIRIGLLVSVILQDKVFNSIWVIYIIVKTIYFNISCDHYLTWPRTASIRLATLSPRTVPNCCSVSGHSIYSIRQNIKNRKQ